MKPLTEKRFLLGFMRFFERIHNAATGSRKICSFDGGGIFEVETGDGDVVMFYLFLGTRPEKEKYFSEVRDAYGTFVNRASTITITFPDETAREYPCAFGYVMDSERLLREFRASEKSERWAEWVAVDICSHEIRHEFQIIRGLSALHTRLPFSAGATGKDVCWVTMRKRFRTFYRSYVRQGLSSSDLAKEMDSISTSYLALRAWCKPPKKSGPARIKRITRIVRGGT